MREWSFLKRAAAPSENRPSSLMFWFNGSSVSSQKTWRNLQNWKN